MTSEYDLDDFDDDRLRALLAEAIPDFPVTTAFGDRVLAQAARRRAWMRIALGGAGALAVLTVGVLAVMPLAGWGGGHGGHGARRAEAAYAAKLSTGSPAAPTPSPTAASGPASPPSTLSTPMSSAPRVVVEMSAGAVEPPASGQAIIPAWVNSPKQKAVERVAEILRKTGHEKSFMGVTLSEQNDTGEVNVAAAYDDSPIVVYRKPIGDRALEQTAISAAAPFSVVFRDTVLDASEQWYLGHRLEQDRADWARQGVAFGYALQQNGTITISAADPDKVVALLEQRYGYDGRVFVGLEDPLQPSAAKPTTPSR